MSDPATYEVAGGIATITLDRAEARNALSPDLMDAVGDRLEDAAADPLVRAVVLTNNGPAFCAGADLKAGGLGSPRHSLADLLRAMQDHPKPVVGRIAGHCMGGGVGLAAACDISVAASDAMFGFTEVRIGVAPAIISVVCLPKLRPGDARHLFLTGERFDAARAAEIGLVNKAVPRAELDAVVASLLSDISKGAPGALTAAKELLRRIPALQRDEAFEWAAKLSRELFASDEARAGMAAFREKQRPPWA
ncbi:MAG: enoyl-CoA hydratase/isomerase family protein, partial [Acidimicrobiales bacterium]